MTPLARCLAAASVAVAAAPAWAEGTPAAPPATPRPAASQPSGRAVSILTFRLLARQEAERAGIPFDLVDAVMKIESDYDPTRIGGVGEVGLMQVRPTTAAMLGFAGEPGALAVPVVNIHYGTAYLAGAWRSAKGNVCRTLMKYRAGQGEEGMSPLSVQYCTRARDYLTSVASPFAAAITPADLVATIAGASPGRPAPLVAGAVAPAAGLRGRSGARFWTVFEARVRRINARIEARWNRVAAR